MGPGTEDAGAGPQLACGIVNKAGGRTAPNVIYITPDRGYNQVTLRLALTTGNATLTPGGIPDPAGDPPAPGTGTTIYADLKALALTDEGWRQLTFSADGWTLRAFPGQGVVGMTPTEKIQLAAGAESAIGITVGGIVVPAPLPEPQVRLYVDYYNIAELPGQYSTFAVALQNAPGAGADLQDAIGVSLSASGIINTVPGAPAAANQFTLQFAARQGAAIAGPDTVFTVGFIYGGPGDQYGYGALASVEQAAAFTVQPADGAAGWAITPDRNAQSPVWTLQPPDGKPVVGAKSVVGIAFSNVVTTYQPGPTELLISYRGVPGYRDGVFALVLEKIAHVVVRSLEVSPSPARFDHGTAAVTVRWRAEGAQRLELTQNYQSSTVTGKTSQKLTLDAENTTLTLKATGRPGTVDNSDQRTVHAVALPVIRSFTAVPADIYYGADAHPVRFAWQVDSVDDVTLSSTSGAFDGQSFRPAGQTSVNIGQAQLVTLAPKTAAQARTLIRQLAIRAFSLNWVTIFPQWVTPWVVASPTGPFVVTAGPGTSVSALETVRYWPIGNEPVGHPVSMLAFSADGTTLAVVGADSTVTALTVKPGAGGRPAFEAAGTVGLGGAPQHLVISRTGQAIYVTTDPGDGTRGHVVPVLRDADGGYQAGTPVAAGRGPRGLTFDASGSRLFVANSGDDNVTVVGLDQAGLPAGTSVISHLEGSPQGVAATPDGRELLVSCAAAGTVVVLDPDRPGTGQRNTLQVGGTPGQVVMMAGGGYAAVASNNGATALIDCGATPNDARVAFPAPPNPGPLPAGVSASPDGANLLICARGVLRIMVLEAYQPSAVAPAVPGGPNSVAVTADDGTVFAWRDAGADPPGSGVHAYRPGSGAGASLLPGAGVLSLAPSPAPDAGQAFAITAGDPALQVIATGSLAVTRVPLDLPAGTTPAALAATGDGQHVLVVTRDAAGDRGLLVLRRDGTGWRAGRPLPLYRGKAGGRLRLRAVPDGSAVFLADDAAAQVRVLLRAGQDYALSPTVIPLPGDGTAVDLAVLPDGSAAYVLGAKDDKASTITVTVIDAATLASRAVIAPAPYLELAGLQPAADGRVLFGTDPGEAVLRVLDPRSLRVLQSVRLAPVPEEAAGAAGLAVFPDGSRVVTANTVSQNLSFVEQVQLGTGPKPDGEG